MKESKKKEDLFNVFLYEYRGDEGKQIGSNVTRKQAEQCAANHRQHDPACLCEIKPAK